ncbi:Hint domain-containing protein, partial [Kitasatospora sp. NPDC093558]|uniref:Hint domain-containing protein n=1 Tax=Kitasatospora sp. NPDC093558 TaxID=3155201 RepID=UPI003427399C
AGLVGANTAVRAGFTAARATRAASRTRRFASRARSVFRRTGCNSFAPDTPVLMGDGGQLPIGVVQVGDEVLSTDPATGETRPEPVLSVIYGYGTKHLVDIETAGDGATEAGPALRVTAEHPVWVPGQGWTDAAKVRVGDSLVTPAGTPVAVTRVTDLGEVADQLVVNLTIGDQHTYSVRSGDDWVVTHNKSCRIDLAHVLGGHGSVSRVAGKSRFRSRNVKEVKYLIHTTVKKGKSRPNTDGRAGRIYEHDFGRIVGRDSRGRHTTRVRVVVLTKKGRRTARTAHPY